MKLRNKAKRKLIKATKQLVGLENKKPIRKYFTKETKQIVLKLQRYRCATFRCRFPSRLWRLLEFDHIRNRDDSSVSNCQALCPTCHRLKGRMDRIKLSIDKKRKVRIRN